MQLILALTLSFLTIHSTSFAAPPKLSIFHFDVNVGDATLIVSPDGHGILIDAGDNGRGKNPINEFLNRNKFSETTNTGLIKSLDYVVSTHYDADHIGGMDEVLSLGWYPEIAVYDRGDTNLRPFVREKLANCSKVNLDEMETFLAGKSAPAAHCPTPKMGVTCRILQYFTEAIKGGKRKTIVAGDVLEMDHGLKITTLITNATDIDGENVDPYITGRRKDCVENDLSIGLLVEFGDFRYLIAGDLTGDPDEKVVNVEELIKDDAQDVDVYHINHHGAQTSSSLDFMQAIHPTVAIVSNGFWHGHPRKTVIEDRILSLDPPPEVFMTNLNTKDDAWQGTPEAIADLNLKEYDGMIEIAVWKRPYRVWRWRDGERVDNPGRKFMIKDR